MPDRGGDSVHLPTQTKYCQNSHRPVYRFKDREKAFIVKVLLDAVKAMEKVICRQCLKKEGIQIYQTMRIKRPKVEDNRFRHGEDRTDAQQNADKASRMPYNAHKVMSAMRARGETA